MDLILNPVESYTVQRRAKQKEEERLRASTKEREREREKGVENFHNRGSLYRTSKLSELFLDYGSLIKGRRGEKETDHLYSLPSPYGIRICGEVVFASRRP